MDEEKSKQKELFPDHIREELPVKGWGEYKMRGENNPKNLKPYEKFIRTKLGKREEKSGY